MSQTEEAYLKCIIMKVEKTMGFRVKVGVWKFILLLVSDVKWRNKASRRIHKMHLKLL